MSENEQQPLTRLAESMKQDWDERAREDSRWYINTIKRNQNDDEFDATGKPEVENFILADPLITRGRDLKAARLLEIGCGIGRMTRRLVNLFGEVHGTDVSAEMIEQARARFRGTPNAFFYETNGLDFAALPRAHFDVIFSVYVFQHVPSPEVVRANLRDACRVLAPGGVFKFQVCGIDHPDYERMQKDTWTGTPFAESAIRQAARENRVRCLSIHGLGTQYCWAVFQKPAGSAPAFSAAPPQIECYGRTDAPEIKAIPTNGDHASLSLIVSGLDPAEDINSLLVEIDGQDFPPHYLGPVGDHAWTVFQGDSPAPSVQQIENRSDLYSQVNLFTSPATPQGRVRICLKDARGRVSNAVSVEVLEPQVIPPRIHMVNNAIDGGVDIYAAGTKSVFRVFADRMDETASVENVQVQVGELKIKPESVTFLPANGFYLAIVRLPSQPMAGEAEVRIQFRDLVSEPAKIRIIG